MYDTLALKVNCPYCDKSLMDVKTLVDNMPSVKVNISFNGEDGIIHLSSIYGSYNYTTNLKIPPGKEVIFSCPYCKEIITSEFKCDLCSATMVPLKIETGGTVRICSRAGCKKHSVEFDDLQHALEHFSMNFAYGDFTKTSEFDTNEEIEEELLKSDLEIIKTGTFLRAYCPHCEESLFEPEANAIIFKITKNGNEKGFLKLSPILNVFTNESTFYIPEGETVNEIQCPHCNASLLQDEGNCELCGSKIVAISIAALSKIIDFYFCSKKGCRWHGLSKEDIDDIALEDSNEW
ncbi:MAG: hypothetical protein JXA54_17210 [Candidatus Heimdallarchaeota archaeon]|nr:hypothetical protein [Candidatus Heimdallarchaeota archaeon]